MNKHIIITPEQAEQIKGRYGKYSAIEPVALPDGKFIIPERCLSDADLAEAKAKIEAANGEVQNIIDLPDVGEPCEEDRIYRYESEISPFVICRQPHNRTIDAIKDIPNLFTFFRENSDDLDWIPNELVEPGWKRMYNGDQWEFIGASKTLTVIGQTPNLVPALWAKVSSQDYGDAPQWNTSDYYKYIVGTLVYNKGAIWRAKNTSWTYIEPALSGNGSLSWEWVADYTPV